MIMTVSVFLVDIYYRVSNTRFLPLKLKFLIFFNKKDKKKEQQKMVLLRLFF